MGQALMRLPAGKSCGPTPAMDLPLFLPRVLEELVVVVASRSMLAPGVALLEAVPAPAITLIGRARFVLPETHY